MKSGKRILPLLSLILIMLSSLLYAQDAAPGDRKIEFPDIPGYRTLKCDLHMHTVFSDGNVWPSIRVEEAIRDGLDAISITDHIEYQPHKNDIPHPDRNRSNELAQRAAKGSELLIIPGTEITRSMPPGHFNAIFVEDVNKLMDEDVFEVFREAKKQGAFVFWNHPHWTAQQKDGVASLKDMHKQLLEEGLFQGIEIYNETTYSDEAVEIAMAHDLTMIGTSDIHGLIDWLYEVPEGHRPVTLVFAREKSVESMKSAMFEGSTAVWFDNTLVGPEEFLTPLIEASLEIQRSGKGLVPVVEITNHSDADFLVENLSEYRLHNQAAVLVIKAHATTRVEVKAGEAPNGFELSFRVLNAFTAPGQHPVIRINAK